MHMAAEKPFRRYFPMKMVQTKMCEAAQPKCTWICAKKPFRRECSMNMLPAKTGATFFMRACAVEMHMDICEETFYASMFNENASDQDLEKLALQTLCEPAQSKCTWTSHKSHFMQEFTAKMLGIRWSTLI